MRIIKNLEKQLVFDGFCRFFSIFWYQGLGDLEHFMKISYERLKTGTGGLKDPKETPKRGPRAAQRGPRGAKKGSGGCDNYPGRVILEPRSSPKD